MLSNFEETHALTVLEFHEKLMIDGFSIKLTQLEQTGKIDKIDTWLGNVKIKFNFEPRIRSRFRDLYTFSVRWWSLPSF